jgi:hypothetical protein
MISIGREICRCGVLLVFLVVRRGFYDGFEGVPWFSNEHLEKCRAIFDVAVSVGVLNGESYGDAVFLVICQDIVVY